MTLFSGIRLNEYTEKIKIKPWRKYGMAQYI